MEESNPNRLAVLHSVWEHQVREEEGTPSLSYTEQSDGEEGGQDQIRKLTRNVKKSLLKNMMERTVSKRAEYAGTINQDAVTKMDLEIEDYGQEKLLPSFKCRRPNKDYFDSSVNVRNMNFINPTTLGQSSIYLYDERTQSR